jgi:very-short-patch-repair endonuclease
MERRAREAVLADLAELQFGVFARRQAFAAGYTRDSAHRCVASGEWQMARRGVYRMRGAPRSWHQDLMSAVIWAGPGAAASHRSAAALWALDGFPPGGVEVSASRQLRSRSAGTVVHKVEPFALVDLARLSGIPVTAAGRTLLDLAAVVPKERVEVALEDALRRGLVSLDRLGDMLFRLGRRGRRGAGRFHELLRARDPSVAPPESVLEARLLRLLAEARLPAPARQYEIWDAGRLVARADFAYPDSRVVIEADGYAYHSGRAAWQRDLIRHNALVALGWRVLRFSWPDVLHRGRYVVDRVRAMRDAGRN